MNEGPDTLAEMHIACLGVVERLWLRQCETQVFGSLARHDSCGLQGPGRIDLMNQLLDEMQQLLEECLESGTGSSLGAGVVTVGFMGSMEALPR